MKQIKGAGPGGTRRGADDDETLSSNTGPVNSGQSRLDAVRKYGFHAATHSPEAVAMMRDEPDAYLLANLIAMGAQRENQPNEFNLKAGQAVCPYRKVGWTRKRFARAKAVLAKREYAEFGLANKPGGKGGGKVTVGRLLDTRLFSVFEHRKTTPKTGQWSKVHSDTAGQHDREGQKIKRVHSLYIEAKRQGLKRPGAFSENSNAPLPFSPTLLEQQWPESAETVFAYATWF